MPVEQSVIERWMAGGPIPGVEFQLNEPVRIVAGRAAGQRAWVICLVELEPEPTYTVELDSGREDLHVVQSALAPC